MRHTKESPSGLRLQFLELQSLLEVTEELKRAEVTPELMLTVLMEI